MGEETLEFQRRIVRLERRVHVLLAAWTLTAASLLLYACAGIRGTGAEKPGGAGEVLRVRGLIVEDKEGRPRILLGAPVPAVAERKRKDAATGMVLLGENGQDRLQVGNVGDPQMGGTVQRRISPATGLMVNDVDGDERGGLGAFENGQVGWGLDYPGREGIVAAVMPDRNLAGLILSANQDENAERAVLLVRGEETTLQLSDSAGRPRAVLNVKGTAQPSFKVSNDKGEELLDLFGKGVSR